MVLENSLTLSCRVDRPIVCVNEDAEAILMVSIEAKQEEEEEPRRGINCIIVLDSSASMGENSKLELCKRTLEFLCQDVLSAKDKLGLVVFDSEARTILPLAAMTDENRTLFIQKIRQLVPGDHTNLSGGLFMGVDMLRSAQMVPEDVNAVLLLSDGEATSGLTDRAKIVRITKNALEAFGECKPTIHAFGYGATYDPVLKEIATISSGVFHHVVNLDEIPLAFADAMGGLLSVAGQNVTIDLELEGGSSHFIPSPLTKYPLEIVSTQRCRLKVRDVYLGERKDILIKIAVSQYHGGTSVTMCKATLKYMDVIKEEFVVLQSHCSFERVVDAVVVEPDIHVARQLLRVEVANTLEAARESAEAGAIAESRSRIERNLVDATRMMNKLGMREDGDPMLHDVLGDLRSARVALNSVATRSQFQASGLARTLEEATWTHAQQRSNVASESDTRTAYMTTPRVKAQAKAKSWFPGKQQ